MALVEVSEAIERAGTKVAGLEAQIAVKDRRNPAGRSRTSFESGVRSNLASELHDTTSDLHFTENRQRFG